MGEEKDGRMNRRRFVQSCLSLPVLAPVPLVHGAVVREPDDRASWIRIVTKISTPVLQALSERKLKEKMPVEAPHGNVAERRLYTHLEAMGRLLCGLAAWLESGATAGEEGATRRRFAEWARMGIQSATDPASPDSMNFNQGNQPVVDTAFLALAIVRAPNELWHKLDGRTQRQVISAFESSRMIRPFYSNWLLFSAMVEAALALMGVWWDPMRVDYAIRSLDSWYKGDGVYGDGPPFHWDYYNSFVMHPMLLNILETVAKHDSTWDAYRPVMLERARRYAAIQERLIAPDGSFPPIGRSLAYRFGAFHLLAETALHRQLPEDVAPAAVRSALTAVMQRMTDAPGTFDAQGWLQIGFAGHQPEIAEPYISTGSCYLCSAAWLPLGLPPTDPFWADPAADWTAKKAWSGQEVRANHALADAARAFLPTEGNSG